MEQTLEFRPVTTDEEVALAARLADEIWHECYAELLSPSQIDYMVASFQSAEAIRASIDNDGYKYYILYNEDTPAGYLGVQAREGRLLLSKIYLLAAQRGRGLAGALFAFCDGLAGQLGCHTQWLTVNKQNARAAAAYQKAGFHLAREQVADIGGGYVMDDFVFEKSMQ